MRPRKMKIHTRFCKLVTHRSVEKDNEMSKDEMSMIFGKPIEQLDTSNRYHLRPRRK